MKDKRHVRKFECEDDFPANQVCPICDTNSNGKSVFVDVAGTGRYGIMDKIQIHLACAIIKQWDEGMQVGFSWRKNED